MKLILFNILIILCCVEISGQVIKGYIFDSNTNEPLEYVSIGIINTPFGTITDDKGYFEFEPQNQNLSSSVRISMIGYEPQIFSIAELLQNDLIIKMIETTYEINEVVIKATLEKKVGANGFNKLKGWSGWGGLYDRKGYEIGIKIDLGNKSVKIKSLHVFLHRQAFDTSFFRLHIRSMKDTLMLSELLTENIIIPVTKESGWVEFNLEKYSLFLSGEIG